MAIFGVLAAVTAGHWSLYDANGNQAVPFDTFFGVDITNEGTVTTYPTEPNSFAAYNKVFAPITADVTVGISGDSSTLKSMLTKLDALLSGTDLVSIVTPEKTFTDYALEAYSYSRTSDQGYDRLKVTLRLVEVKQVAAEYSNEQISSSDAKNASDSSTTSAGKQATDKTSEGEKKAAETKSTQKKSLLSSVLN